MPRGPFFTVITESGVNSTRRLAPVRSQARSGGRLFGGLGDDADDRVHHRLRAIVADLAPNGGFPDEAITRLELGVLSAVDQPAELAMAVTGTSSVILMVNMPDSIVYAPRPGSSGGNVTLPPGGSWIRSRWIKAGVVGKS